MSKILATKRSRLAELAARARTLQETEPAEGVDPMVEIRAITTEMNTLQADIEALASLRESETRVNPKHLGDPGFLRETRDFTSHMESRDSADERMGKRFSVGRKVRCLEAAGFQPQEARRTAYRFGMWALAALGYEAPAEYCRENGIAIRLHKETNNAGGGFLVPEEFETAVIVLRELYGVFRQHAKIVTMGSDTKRIPRRTGGLTAYFVGEGQAITESTKGWDGIMLVAKKAGVLAKVTSELNEDALIDMAADLMDEMAYAFAMLEDDCGFNGDGSSAANYGGIIGVRKQLLDTGTAGTKTSASTAFTAYTLAEYEACVALLPQYADDPDAGWYAHRTCYWNSMIQVALAAGGVTQAEISNLGRRVPFLGYPVNVAQKMPSAGVSGKIGVLFGSLPKAAMLGDRRLITFATSEHLNFAEDEIAVRATQRFDINVHDVGDSSNPGPIVGIKSA